jgi:hypothetical protein
MVTYQIAATQELRLPTITLIYTRDLKIAVTNLSLECISTT